MPRAIEIYVDEKQKAVLINTNYGNREVRGASWEPITYLLGWDDAPSISHAARCAVSGFECNRIALVDEAGIVLTVACFLSRQQEMIVKAFKAFSEKRSV